MPRTTKKIGLTQRGSDEGNPYTSRTSQQIENYHNNKKQFEYKKNDRGKIIKIELNKGGLSAKQKKIAAKAPPPDKIDAKDFAVLKAEKAKGRGMGLQDESIKPGKVMKAKTGKQIVKEFSASLKGIDESYKDKVHPMKKQRLMDRNKVMTKAKYGKAIKTELRADPTKPISSVAPKASDILKKKKLPGAIGTALGIGSMMVPAAYGVMKQYKDYKSAKNRDEAKVKKMVGGMAKKYSKGSEKKLMTPEERADYVKKAKVSLKATAESLQDKLHPKKSDRLFSKHKKMGGGMMQKPMGYKSGMGPAGAGGSMAGRPGGRRPMQQGPKGGIGSLPKKRNSDDLVVIFSTKDGTKQIKRSDLDNMSAPEKKMGGGMMQRPMGYKKGVMVKARGCKLGRTRPTKMY